MKWYLISLCLLAFQAHTLRAADTDSVTLEDIAKTVPASALAVADMAATDTVVTDTTIIYPDSPLAKHANRADTSHYTAYPLDNADNVDTVEVRYAYYERVSRYKRDWALLVPNQTVVQFAGSIGMFSIGAGWHYGRGDHWETEILFGYLPRSNGSPHHYTLTAKQRYIPWHIPLSTRSQRWVFEPLTTGLFINTIFGEGFWRHAPSKYTKGYYGFNTKLRYNIYVGQRIRYNIPQRHRFFARSISFYYELSTCDLYLVSAIPNKKVTAADILSLALGLRVELF